MPYHEIRSVLQTAKPKIVSVFTLPNRRYLCFILMYHVSVSHERTQKVLSKVVQL